ncbi:MAG: sigma-70 family RNA polymerase sigma factor [Alphaproteobacteria bacterium]|nr:sigma-70 family RNA polymerase sigma factor [Alphaproteobacteria bacterium]
MSHGDHGQLALWLEQTAKGDDRAFRQLVHALGQRIFGLAFRLLQGDRAQAEDVMQDVLIKLWQNAPKWQAGGSVQAWVSRTTYNACMDIHRSPRKRSVELPEDLPSLADTATDQLNRKEQQDILLKGIKHLPERQQEALLLTYFHENSRKEVARAMATSEKAVEHLVARGLKTLEAHLPANLNGDRHDRYAQLS